MDKILGIRAKEHHAQAMFALNRLFALALSTATPAITLLAMLYLHEIFDSRGKELTLNEIFTALALVNTLAVADAVSLLLSRSSDRL
jgi:hypothetical protein